MTTSLKPFNELCKTSVPEELNQSPPKLDFVAKSTDSFEPKVMTNSSLFDVAYEVNDDDDSLLFNK